MSINPRTAKMKPPKGPPPKPPQQTPKATQPVKVVKMREFLDSLR